MRIGLDAFGRIPGEAVTVYEIVNCSECDIGVVANPGGPDENKQQ